MIGCSDHLDWYSLVQVLIGHERYTTAKIRNYFFGPPSCSWNCEKINDVVFLLNLEYLLWRQFDWGCSSTDLGPSVVSSAMSSEAILSSLINNNILTIYLIWLSGLSLPLSAQKKPAVYGLRLFVGICWGWSKWRSSLALSEMPQRC